MATPRLVVPPEGRPWLQSFAQQIERAFDVTPRPLQIAFIGKPDASQLLWRAEAPSNLLLSAITASSDIAATGTPAFTLKVGGVSVATVSWSGATGTATITDSSISAGSTIHLYAPATQDATLADGTILLTFGEG